LPFFCLYERPWIRKRACSNNSTALILVSLLNLSAEAAVQNNWYFKEGLCDLCWRPVRQLRTTKPTNRSFAISFIICCNEANSKFKNKLLEYWRDLNLVFHKFQGANELMNQLFFCSISKKEKLSDFQQYWLWNLIRNTEGCLSRLWGLCTRFFKFIN